MQGEVDTVGCKPVLDELVVDVEGPKDIGKVEEDLVLGLGGLGDVGGDAGDGVRASAGCAGVRNGLEAVVARHGGAVAVSVSACLRLTMADNEIHINIKGTLFSPHTCPANSLQARASSRSRYRSPRTRPSSTSSAPSPTSRTSRQIDRD